MQPTAAYIVTITAKKGLLAVPNHKTKPQPHLTVVLKHTVISLVVRLPQSYESKELVTIKPPKESWT